MASMIPGRSNTWIPIPGARLIFLIGMARRSIIQMAIANPGMELLMAKPVPMGTYYYIINPKNGREIMSGYVDVIR